MKKLADCWAVAAALCAILAFPAFADRKPDPAKLGQKFQDANAVLQELLSSPDRKVPEELLEKARCIAVIPHAVKGALGYGARFGSGVMSCRTENGEWSPPSFVRLAGGSFGIQIGVESSDLVLFFMTERGAHSLLTSSKVTLGGNASVAAGPFGRTGEASTDLKLNAEIYTYAKSKGAFAGLSIEGARLSADDEANARFYGPGVTVKQLLFEPTAPAIPAGAEAFRKSLP